MHLNFKYYFNKKILAPIFSVKHTQEKGYLDVNRFVIKINNANIMQIRLLNSLERDLYIGRWECVDEDGGGRFISLIFDVFLVIHSTFIQMF